MDVVALDELLIDFTENGVSSQGNQLFEANPGGAVMYLRCCPDSDIRPLSSEKSETISSERY